jgi:DNA-binding CsgD family transcriptional regulator/DNA polymerase III delta prime subunit
MLTVVRSAWPLRARDGELVELVALLQRGRGVLLAGPSGVGKTSLAVAVAEEMEHAGWTVVRVFASRPTAGIPFGALAVLFPPAGPLDEVVAASVQVRAGIVAIATDRRAVLVMDDAQWLDEASAVVLHQLVAQGEATLLATLRSGEPAPDPVTALWKDGLVERIEVAPLGDEAVRDVLEAALDGPVETLTGSRLWRRCGGNVLYLRELVGEAERLGLLQRREGLWCIDTLPPGSPRLAELVAERLGALDEPARAGLEVIAVGEPVRLAMLDELVDRDTLERLESAGVIVVSGSGDDAVVRPAHPVFGDVVRSSLPELRRRRVMRGLADIFEQRGAASRDDIIRLALWRLDGGGAATPELLLGAARQAHFAFDGTTAERLARAAWAADGGFEAARVLADVLFARGGFVEREELLAAVAVTAATDEQRALVAASRAVGMFWGLADADAAERVLVAAEGEVNDPVCWSEVRATRATLVGQTGRHREVLGLLAGLPDDAGGRGRLQAALAEAFALPGIGRGEDAVARIDAALSAAAQLGPQPTLFTAGLLLSPKAVALAGLGRLDDAAAVARSGLETAVETGNRAAEAFFGSTLGWVQLNQGLLVSAQRTYRESAAAFRSISYGGPLRWALGGLLFAAALARDKEVVGVAAGALDALDPHPAALFDTTISRARAWAAVVEGDPEWGRRLLGEAAADARSRGAVVEEGTVLHDLARLGRADEVADRLHSLAAAAQGDLVRVLADSAAGLARGSPDALGDIAERFAGLGFNMRAAESAMAASEASARAHDQRGAARWARRATELAALCEAAAPVVELVGAAGPVPLTNREREIALLAADGLASRVIAERLFVSVRTVENHLARIYTKLGVASRAELAELVRR